MHKILITGGSGFIGTNLVEYYSNLGNEVVNIDKNCPRNPAHQKRWVQCDILDLPKMKGIFHNFNPEFIFHLAARTDLDGVSLDDYLDNTVGVENLIEAVTELKDIKGIIFASSRLVCEIGYVPRDFDDYRPTTLYGESKVLGEKIVKTSQVIPCPWDIVRPTSIWGPWFDVPYKNFFTAVLSGRYFHPNGRKIFKSFGYVGNTVYELDRLIFRIDSQRRHTFYLGDYPPLEVKEFADLISSESGGTRVPEIPISILRILALSGDLLKACGYKNPPLTKFRLDNLLTEMTFDLGPLQEVVGELPFTLAEGVHETLSWMKRN